MEKLQRSIIGETAAPINILSIREELTSKKLHIVDVSDLGAYKVLITFDSQENAQEALAKEMEPITKHFEEIRAWSEVEWCQTRRVWLECYGIPLHAWSGENMKKIGEEWGSVVAVDTPSKEGISYSSAKILIDTCVWQLIHDWIYLSINGMGFDVYVKEVGWEVFSLESKSKIRTRNSKVNSGDSTFSPERNFPMLVQQAVEGKGINTGNGENNTASGSGNGKDGDGCFQQVVNATFIPQSLAEMEEAANHTAPIIDDQNSEEIINKHVQMRIVRAKKPIKGPKVIEPIENTCEGMGLCESSSVSAPPGFGPTKSKLVSEAQPQDTSVEMVAESFDRVDEDDGRDGEPNLETDEDPQFEATCAWNMGVELGLQADKEEDIMTLLELKNREREAKRKAKRKNKNRRNTGDKALKSGVFTNS